LCLTYSVKGAFTKKMEAVLHEGNEVWVKLPYGELFSPASRDEQCVFLAGGTGVTPFLSLFSSQQFAQYPNPVLYFGVRSKHYNLYDEDFKKAQMVNTGFVFHIQYEDTEGFMKMESIFKQYSAANIFYLSGPPAMITSFKHSLLHLGVPLSNIKTDEWE
jgi:predicted ferric reductase